MTLPNPQLIAARIVDDAGGELVGRTRLQKVAYLMQLAGLLDGLSFEYHHYGPYSEDLARGIDIAAAFGEIVERQLKATWGGHYSIFESKVSSNRDPMRGEFIDAAKRINAIELELAATAAFLYVVECEKDPWEKTRILKPEKAEDGRLERAKEAYEELRKVRTPATLPAL